MHIRFGNDKTGFHLGNSPPPYIYDTNYSSFSPYHKQFESLMQMCQHKYCDRNPPRPPFGVLSNTPGMLCTQSSHLSIILHCVFTHFTMAFRMFCPSKTCSRNWSHNAIFCLGSVHRLCTAGMCCHLCERSRD